MVTGSEDDVTYYSSTTRAASTRRAQFHQRSMDLAGASATIVPQSAVADEALDMADDLIRGPVRRVGVGPLAPCVCLPAAVLAVGLVGFTV